MTRMIDRTGHVYGYLTVIEIRERRNKNGRIVWKCQCKCGSRVVVEARHLQAGNTRSCGCLRIEIARRKKELRESKSIGHHPDVSMEA